MSKRMVHIVWNKQEQLSFVCFPYFSLCLTFLKLVVTSELPTAVTGRRSDFTVLHCGAAEKKTKHDKLDDPAEVRRLRWCPTLCCQKKHKLCVHTTEVLHVVKEMLNVPCSFAVLQHIIWKRKWDMTCTSCSQHV